MTIRKATYGAAIALMLTAAAPAAARDHLVEMKDHGAAGAMVFEPAFVRAAPGDTIRFIPRTPLHSAETIPTLLPAGVKPSRGTTGKEFDLTVSKPGLYGIRCMPHYAMGMVALVEVGKAPPADLAAARAATLPPLAQQRMRALLDMVK